MKNIIILICIVLFFFISVPTAYAQSTSAISVSPVIFNITLSPGKVEEFSLKVKNNLEIAVPVHLSLENLDITRDDETESSPLRSIASWVTFSEQDMIIEPKSERTVTFSVQVPDKIALGGYYGMIYLRPFSSVSPTGADANISSKIGILLLGSVGVQEIPLNKIELLSPRFSQLVYEGKELNMKFSVKNSALNHFSAKPFLRIQSLFGNMQDISLEEKIIFPGRTREWTVPISLKYYPHLLYRAELFVSVGGGEQKKTSLYFVAFPLLRILLVIFGIILGSMMMRNRKRLREAVRAFIKG